MCERVKIGLMEEDPDCEWSEDADEAVRSRMREFQKAAREELSRRAAIRFEPQNIEDRQT